MFRKIVSLSQCKSRSARDGLAVLLVSVIAAGSVWAKPLEIRHEENADVLRVFPLGEDKPVLTQHARPDFRPYLHPIEAPDNKGVLTQHSPSHHKHQTGIYWGFTRVNGRDYFHHPEGDYWRRVSVKGLQPKSQGDDEPVSWQTIYDLLDENGDPILTETQIWTMRAHEDRYVLDLQWIGHAKTDITVGKYDYGGLFIRMPWSQGTPAAVVNAARHRDLGAEGQRAPWIDLAMQVAGRTDPAHIAVFDHPKNHGFPQPWRVDGQFGVGPAPTRLGDWQIAEGEQAVLRYQLQMYTGPLNDLKLTNAWSKFSGQRRPSILWGIARKEGRAAELLSPQQAVDVMQPAEGFEVNVWASEPMITQPMAFCWDDRGRMWVAENRDYESRGEGFANSGDSRILILEDTDRDGVADRRKVFLEGIPFPSAIAVGFDGLWLGAPPNLLFVPDRDGDDRADMDDIEVRLTGWGIRDRHETLNSLHWGPDGWLYGCQGFATPSRVGKPTNRQFVNPSGPRFPQQFEFAGPISKIDGGVWRYHPAKDRFEVVAHGFSNPWGIDYDAKGQLFITACVIPHLWHVVPGGIYHRQGGRHLNPYFYSDIETIADHRHRSAHGGARVYLSDAYPDRYQGQIFMANIHEHAVLADVLEPRGSGFVGRHGEDFLLANNAQWIGFGIEIGPDGNLYVLDWHDADICGTDVLNKDTGRVFRIAPTVSQAEPWPDRYADLKSLPDEKLVRLQKSSSAWHARRGRLVLQGRAAQGKLTSQTPAALWEIFREESNVDHRLRALWALHAVKAVSHDDLIEALGDSEEYVRAWAIQLLCEDMSPSSVALDRFVQMSGEDRSPVVRLYLAAALQRMETESRWPIARELVQHAEDADDHNLPKMIWFGIEPAVPQAPRRAIELAAASRIPLVSRFIARRLADADQLDSVVGALIQSKPVRTSLLLGIRDALAGRVDAQPPPIWHDVYSKLQAEAGEGFPIARQIAQQFGDTQAAKEMLATLQDDSSNIENRVTALRDLSQRRHPDVRPLLQTLLDDSRLRRAVIQAIAAYDDDRLADALLSRYASFTAEEKLDVIHTLAARSRFGRRLTEAIKRGDVPKRDIPAYVARLLRRVVGPRFVDVWGPVDELSAGQEEQLSRFRELLTADALAQADLGRGAAVFGRTCLTCHKFYGKGGAIGPELTGANRTNREYLLGNILTPSAVIQDAYRMQLVLTDDGRVYSGILAGEDERQIELREVGLEDPVTIPKSRIESREVAPISMMPEGLLKNLSDAEVVDLFAYLMKSP